MENSKAVFISTRGVIFDIDEPDQYQFKLKYGLLELTEQCDVFIVSGIRLRINNQPLNIRDHLVAMMGKYVKVVIAIPAPTYMRQLYNYINDTTDNFEQQVAIVELLPVKSVTCKVASVNNHNMHKTVIDAYVAGDKQTFEFEVQHPLYFSLCCLLEAGASLAISYVDSDISKIITNITDEIPQTAEFVILGYRHRNINKQFTTPTFEVVCKDTNMRFVVLTRPNIINGKKYTITYKQFHQLANWFIIDSIV